MSKTPPRPPLWNISSADTSNRSSEGEASTPPATPAGSTPPLVFRRGDRLRRHCGRAAIPDETTPPASAAAANPRAASAISCSRWYSSSTCKSGSSGWMRRHVPPGPQGRDGSGVSAIAAYQMTGLFVVNPGHTVAAILRWHAPPVPAFASCSDAQAQVVDHSIGDRFRHLAVGGVLAAGHGQQSRRRQFELKLARHGRRLTRPRGGAAAERRRSGSAGPLRAEAARSNGCALRADIARRRR